MRARRFAFLSLSFSALCVAQAAGNKPLPAEPAPLAAQSLLIDIAPAGTRFVAVGERGHVLTSDDGGASWTQAKQVPVQSQLTGVCFFDAKRGIAVGHDETILSTSDGGSTWSLTHYAPEKQQPLLDVWCGEHGHAIAVGAYSAFYESGDGGSSWVARATPIVSVKSVATASIPASKVVAGAAPGVSGGVGEESDAATASHGVRAQSYDDDIPQDYHFNRIIAASATRLYIAAEAGHLYRSDDAGASWISLPSPYEGSFFGALALSNDEVLAFGLRGNLYRSRDAGATWQRVETHTTAMLNDGVRLDANNVAIVGLSGAVLMSHDNGVTFELQQQTDRRGLSATLPASPNTLAIVGEGGTRLVRVNP